MKKFEWPSGTGKRPTKKFMDKFYDSPVFDKVRIERDTLLFVRQIADIKGYYNEPLYHQICGDELTVFSYWEPLFTIRIDRVDNLIEKISSIGLINAKILWPNDNLDGKKLSIIYDQDDILCLTDVELKYLKIFGLTEIEKSFLESILSSYRR